MYKVFIDPGHGGSDPGAVYENLQEKTLNLAVAMALQKYLMMYKEVVQTKLSRDTDTQMSISTRTNKANEWGADLVVSIHFNSSSSGKGDGIEAIHSVVGGESKVFAELAVNTVSELTGQNLRPTKTYSKAGTDGKDYFGVLRLTKAPAVIMECAFVNNPVDIKDFDEDHELQALGVALGKAILRHYKIEEIKEQPEDTQERHYGVCVGSFHNLDNASDYISELNKNGLNGYTAWVPDLKVTRVFATPKLNRAEAEKLKETCKSAGFTPFFVEE